MGSVYSWKVSKNQTTAASATTKPSLANTNPTRTCFRTCHVYCNSLYEDTKLIMHIQTHVHAAGIPLNVAASFGFHVSVSVSHMAKLRCNDTLEDNTNVSACTLSFTTLDRRPAGIRCFQTGRYLLQIH